jgi:hypothetical protein
MRCALSVREGEILSAGVPWLFPVMDEDEDEEKM